MGRTVLGSVPRPSKNATSRPTSASLQISSSVKYFAAADRTNGGMRGLFSAPFAYQPAPAAAAAASTASATRNMMECFRSDSVDLPPFRTFTGTRGEHGRRKRGGQQSRHSGQ